MSRSHAAVCVIAFLSAWGIELPASDPVGIYASVDRVVFEPDRTAPERVQIWGAFSLAKSPGGTYFPPERGYFYYSLPAGSEKAARAEWFDLDGVGSWEVVAFGSRYEPLGRVRRGCEEAEVPDTYPINFGLTRITNPSFVPAVDLLSLPRPVNPFDGVAGWPPSNRRLIVQNVRYEVVSGLKYYFEIESGYSGTEREQSPALDPGSKAPLPDHTSWTPSFQFTSGVTYRWRSWVAAGDYTGPKAEACFQAGYIRGDANGDTQVDLTDPIVILNYLFLAGQAPEPLEVADVNDSGEVDITDSIYLLNYEFLGGPAPVAFE